MRRSSMASSARSAAVYYGFYASPYSVLSTVTPGHRHLKLFKMSMPLADSHEISIVHSFLLFALHFCFVFSARQL